jgi:hypothetical protein
VQYWVKIEWDHAYDQRSVPYPWTIKWKDQTLFSFYQSFGIRIKDVHIYVNILICHRVGSAQNVCLVIGAPLVIDIFTLVVPLPVHQSPHTLSNPKDRQLVVARIITFHLQSQDVSLPHVIMPHTTQISKDPHNILSLPLQIANYWKYVWAHPT